MCVRVSETCVAGRCRLPPPPIASLTRLPLTGLSSSRGRLHSSPTADELLYVVVRIGGLGGSGDGREAPKGEEQTGKNQERRHD